MVHIHLQAQYHAHLVQQEVTHHLLDFRHARRARSDINVLTQQLIRYHVMTDTTQQYHLFRAQYAQPGTNVLLEPAPQLHVHPVSTQPLEAHHVRHALLDTSALHQLCKRHVLLDIIPLEVPPRVRNALLVALVLIQPCPQLLAVKAATLLPVLYHAHLVQLEVMPHLLEAMAAQFVRLDINVLTQL